jgi:hypothetical protein
MPCVNFSKGMTNLTMIVTLVEVQILQLIFDVLLRISLIRRSVSILA